MIHRISIILLFATTLAFAAPTVPSQRVGQPLEIKEIYIPGGEVKPKPRRDHKPPLTVRLLETKPAQDGFRYDFEVQGFEPGPHNLADYLEGPEGTVIPAIPLEITTPLDPGITVPHTIDPGTLPKLGGYRNMMILLGAVWLAGLAAILFWKKKKTITSGTAGTAQATLAERLRPLLDTAAKGDLTSDDRAKLDRLIIGHWREKLPEIAALSPAEAMAKLRTHPEASPLILAMERWLHARDTRLDTKEIETLLAPYQKIQ